MSLVQTNVGDLRVVNALRALWNAAAALRIHLVKVDWVPGETTVLANLTEADFAGYASVVAANWTAAATVAGKAQTACDPVVFSRTVTGAAQVIYGYWAEPIDVAGSVWWSEKFAAAVTLTNAGEGLVLYPTYTNDKA